MLYREIIAVFSQIHTKHINTLCGQNVELLNVKLVVHIISINYAVTYHLWTSPVSSANSVHHKTSCSHTSCSQLLTPLLFHKLIVFRLLNKLSPSKQSASPYQLSPLLATHCNRSPAQSVQTMFLQHTVQYYTTNKPVSSLYLLVLLLIYIMDFS
jgi:hypothetical protein